MWIVCPVRILNGEYKVMVSFILLGNEVPALKGSRATQTVLPKLKRWSLPLATLLGSLLLLSV